MSENKPKKRRLSAVRWQEEIDIELGSGEAKTIIVKELMGDQRDAFLNHQASKVKTNKDGIPIGVRDVSGNTTMLLSKALFEPGKEEPMTEAEIKALKLPSRV